MALFKQDPRFTRVKYYEDYNPSKVFLRDSNFEGVEFLVAQKKGFFRLEFNSF
jgi:hypothetical protein